MATQLTERRPRRNRSRPPASASSAVDQVAPEVGIRPHLGDGHPLPGCVAVLKVGEAFLAISDPFGDRPLLDLALSSTSADWLKDRPRDRGASVAQMSDQVHAHRRQMLAGDPGPALVDRLQVLLAGFCRGRPDHAAVHEVVTVMALTVVADVGMGIRDLAQGRIRAQVRPRGLVAPPGRVTGRRGVWWLRPLVQPVCGSSAYATSLRLYAHGAKPRPQRSRRCGWDSGGWDCGSGEGSV
jgi:hypothetical protein